MMKNTKRVTGAGKTRKQAWRRIDHSEIEDTAEYDVTQTFIKRLIHGTDKRQTSEKNKNGQPSKTSEEGLLFQLDPTGTSARLSRSIKRDIHQLEKGIKQLSEHHLKSIEKTQKGFAQREKSLAEEAMNRSLANGVIDLWDGSPPLIQLPLTTSNPPKKRKVISNHSDIIRAPAIKLPSGGQSINPDPNEHEALVLSAVAVEKDKERKKLEFDRSVHPVTYALVFAFYCSLKVADDEDNRFVQLKDFMKEKYGLTVNADDMDEDLPTDEFLGLKVKNAVMVEDSETDEEVQEEEKRFSEAVVVKRKPKTQKDRNRFDRHLQTLKIAAREKEHRKFLSSVDRIKEYLSELQEREEQLKARAEYRQAMADAIREAMLKGIVIKFKCGKHIFEEPSTELILPSVMEKSGGSLRKTMFSHVSGSAIKDRAQSVYRRGLLEAVPAMTPSKLHEVKRQTHWKKKARKLVVKY